MLIFPCVRARTHILLSLCGGHKQQSGIGASLRFVVYLNQDRFELCEEYEKVDSLYRDSKFLKA